MKYYHAVLGVLALVAPMNAAALAYDANAVEAEVVYDDFERNYDGWIPTSDAVRLVATPGAGFDGSRGMVVSGRATPRDGASSSKGLYLKSGPDYKFSVKVYSETEETFLFQLYSHPRFGSHATSLKTIALEKAPAGTWTTLSGAVSVPYEKGDAVRMILTLSTQSTNDFQFDELRIVGESRDYEARVEEKGLKDVFASSFRVGNILNGNTVGVPSIVANILKDHNAIECENELKPESTMVRSQSHDNNVAVSLRAAAPILDFCVNHRLAFRGHTLVWHSQTPSWVFKEGFRDDGAWVDVATMDARMESYIKNLFEAIETQYPDLELYAFDVCNECVSDDYESATKGDGSRRPGDGRVENGASAWVQIYGDNSFIEKAFRLARQYAPEGCALYYNDYNEYVDYKRDRIYEICRSLYEKGLLDGVGMQGHLSANAEGFGGIDACVAAMKKYLSIGCDVQFTEIDVSLRKGGARGRHTFEEQATKYAALFNAAKEWNAQHPEKNRVTAVCLWGPNDANSWLTRGAEATLYDDQNRPKPAYDALFKLGDAPSDK